MKGDDIVADILMRAEQAVREFVARPEFALLLREVSTGGGLEQRIADSIAQQIRRQENPVRQFWSGAEVYIARRPRPDAGKKAAALEQVQRTGRVADAADSHGMSRATLYRMLGGEK